MKKSKLSIAAVLLTSALLLAWLCVAVGADGMKEIDFYDISGMFEMTDDTISCIAVAGDQMCVSEYYVSADEPFVYSATTQQTDYSRAENTGALGLMLAVGDDPDSPIQRGCIIFRTPYAGGKGSTELWTLSTEGALDYSFNKAAPNPLELNQKRTYSLVYDGVGNFYGYADGELFVKVEDSGFEGGYLGLLAWQAAGTYSDISITKDISGYDFAADWQAHEDKVKANEKETAPRVASTQDGGMDVIGFRALTGSFEIGTDTIACTAVAGDQLCVSDYYVDGKTAFVYQATTNQTDFNAGENNGALGLMLSVGDDPDRPIQRGCIIFRTPYAGGNGNTEIWTLSTEGALDYSFSVNTPNPNELNVDRTYALVYDGAGNFYGFADGELFVTVEDSGFKGGYLGLLAWQAAGTYSNFSISHDISAFGIEDKSSPEEGGMDVIGFRALTGNMEIGEDTVTCREVSGDQMCVSDFYVSADEPFVYQATTNQTDFNASENNGALGLMLSVGDDPDRPIQRGCIIFRTPWAGGDGNTEIWTLSTESALDYGFSVNKSNPNQLNVDRTYSLVYDGKGNFYGFADGKCYVAVKDSGFKGGYLGLLAWQAAGTYSDISISKDISGFDLRGAGQPSEGGMDVIGFRALTGSMEVGEDTVVCTAVAGDQLCVSDYYVSADEPFVYQATANMTDFNAGENNGALGLILAVGDDPTLPIQRGCIIFRNPYRGGEGKVEIWTLSTEGALDYEFSVKDWKNIAVGEDRTLTLVYDGAGTFYGYADGELYLTVENSGFKGGYLGLLAWQSAGTYSNLSISHDISGYDFAADQAAHEAKLDVPEAVEEPAAEEPEAQEPVVKEPEVQEPAAQEPVGSGETSPNTFDFGLIALFAAILSGLGFAVTKKR